MQEHKHTPIIYMIRHGEKPPNDGKGLSAQGVTRAQYLPNVFGSSSQYNIGYIIAQHPNKGFFPFIEFYVPLRHPLSVAGGCWNSTLPSQIQPVAEDPQLTKSNKMAPGPAPMKLLHR